MRNAVGFEAIDQGRPHMRRGDDMSARSSLDGRRVT